ncbi:cell division protein FtsQ/DivIB [Polymorphobacter sp.]|uniref:cell division protein FtsQ/DivIB n=1 Tax=Polymorphobacter sp. TaxID=1909290 RepID=UPI003F727F0D
MSRTSQKRGAKPPARGKAAPPPPPRITLPVPVPALRRGLLLGLGGLLLVASLIGAGLARLPQRGLEAARLASAEAGFQIRHVEINGTREMARLPIYEAVLSGPENALLTTDLPAMRSRLMALPWVADASISRRLPDTLVVRIDERKPVALWQSQGRFHLIDITGRVLATQDLARFAGLPLVVGDGANRRVREMLHLTAAANGLAGQIEAGVLIGGRRWNIRFKSGETLALPDTPARARAAILRFAKLETGLAEDQKLLGGRYERFDMRLPGQMTIGGPAVKDAIDAAAKAEREAKRASI